MAAIDKLIVSSFSSSMMMCHCGAVFSASGKPQSVNRKARAWTAKHRDCKARAEELGCEWVELRIERGSHEPL